MNHSTKAFLIGMLYAVICFRRVHLQKQPPEVFLKKVVLGNSVKFTEKNTCAGHSFLFVPFGEIWLG